ncbi:MAG: cysteine desulfurase, partial [Mycobacterium sp.]
MSTSEQVAAGGGLPISEAELASLASALYAADLHPGPDSPPLVVPPAPRGSAPEASAVTTAGTTGVGVSDPLTPGLPTIPVGNTYVPAPTSGVPQGVPQAVPVAPRGSAPDATAPAGYASLGSPSAPPADLTAFAVPTGIVPTVPGVLAGTA